jgi:hypothetical protein
MKIGDKIEFQNNDNKSRVKSTFEEIYKYELRY